VRNIKNSFLFLLVIGLQSCQYFGETDQRVPIASVYDRYLYLDGVSQDIYQNKSSQDSTVAVREFIEKWAYKQLLLVQAEKNIDMNKINKLVQAYKTDLSIDTYKSLWVEEYMDSVIPMDTIAAYYQKNKMFFTAKTPMINSKFLVVDKADKLINKYKKWFFSDKENFQDSLINKSFHFKQFNINNDKWMDLEAFRTKFPVFKHISDRQILKKSKKFVLRDSLQLYLVFVNDLVLEDQALPLSFIKNDLKQLIFSHRKQRTLSKLQTEMKEEAIKKKHFKIYKIKK